VRSLLVLGTGGDAWLAGQALHASARERIVARPEALWLPEADRILLVASSFPESVLDLPLWQGGAPAVLPLGLSLTSLEGDRAARLERWRRETGKLSAADLPTYRLIEERLGPGTARLTGTPALLLEGEPFRARAPRLIFSPRAEASPERNARLARLQAALSRRARFLFLAQEGEDWALGASSGPSTLHCPRGFRVHHKAIASASLVVTGRVAVLEAALASSRAAIFLAGGDRDEAIAETYGVAALRWDRLSPESAVRAIFRLAGAFPEQRVRERVSGLRREMMTLPPRPASPRRPAPRATLSLACIADRAHLPSLVGLLENLREVHGPRLKLDLLALDQAAERQLPRIARDLDYRLHRLEDLWTAEELSRIGPRGPAARAYSSKARLLRRALEGATGAVFYFDLDLFFLRSPATLRDAFGGRSVLLFPHWNHRLSYSRLFGLFNAGMVGVRPGAERFLDWWAELCLHRCEREAERGFYDDQGFLDAAPVCFPEVRIYKGCDEDVAFWNLETLGVEPAADPFGTPRIKNGKPVGSLHAARPDPLGLHELKYAWDQAAAFFSGAASDGLFLQTLEQQRAYLPELELYLKACATLRARLGLGRAEPSARGTRFFVDGGGRALLRGTAALYRTGRRPKRALERWLREWLPAETKGDDFSWIALQQRELYGDGV
jgi:hypothetical protein